MSRRSTYRGAAGLAHGLPAAGRRAPAGRVTGGGDWAAELAAVSWLFFRRFSLPVPSGGSWPAVPEAEVPSSEGRLRTSAEGTSTTSSSSSDSPVSSLMFFFSESCSLAGAFVHLGRDDLDLYSARSQASSRS